MGQSDDIGTSNINVNIGKTTSNSNGQQIGDTGNVYIPTDGTPTEGWFVNTWRPAAAWAYLAICLFDFIVAPICMGLFSYLTHVAYMAWVPLTLQGGGLVHLSFGAIIGVYTYGRTREKIALNSDTNLNMSQPNFKLKMPGG